MASFLPATTYQPLARPYDSANVIEEDDVASYYLSYRQSQLSPSFDDDFPTPKAHMQRSHVPPAIRPTTFDELYDVSDDETEQCPLTCSGSVRFASTPKTPRTPKARLPSLVIPSPSAWPTIEKYRSTVASGLQPSPMPILTPTPETLSQLAARTLEVPSRNATPSLDGSLTSDELSEHSCPPTPATPGAKTQEELWSAGPVQLSAEAMLTLHRLSGDDVETPKSAVDVSNEMMEVARPLTITVTPSAETFDAETLSALSIPSPGGFFSSLGGSARSTWATEITEPIVDEPSTSTAESFYNLPWDSAAPAMPTDRVIQQVVEAPSPTGSAPSTARRILSPISDSVEVAEITVAEYAEGYNEELEATGALSLDRTGEWLRAQTTYLNKLLESPVEQAKPVETHQRKDSGTGSSISRSKSVRFAGVAPESPARDAFETADKQSKDSTFLEGFTYIREQTNRDDIWTHRRERAEALHLDRVCLARSHREQLLGKFHLNAPERPAPARPVSCFYSQDPTVQKEQIELAQKERQALEAIRPIQWNIEATKMLNGGGLLTSPTGKVFPELQNGRVLDLGGQASCDWAWEVAMQYPKSHVYTVFTEEQKPSMAMEGPANHHEQVVPNLWTLPYPSNHFDVISARSLYTMLKTTKPLGQKLDEYDLCLKECLRCLKPGGYLEFSLLDADILRAERQVSALSVEFCFSLRTRGYDAYPTKSFLPRLRKAGFGEMKRAWLALPMTQVNNGRKVRRSSFDVEDILPRPSAESLASPSSAQEMGSESGSTADAGFIAGLVGAWAWEKWMLKLQLEMGKDEDRLLEGVASAMEEGAASGAAWRYLSGWARKPF